MAILCLLTTAFSAHLKTVPILMCFDDRLGGPAAVVLSSVFENANQNTSYDVFIQIPKDFNPDVKMRIGLLEGVYGNCKINFIDMGSLFQDNPKGWVPHTAYFYTVASRFLPEIKKLVFLDGDVMVRHDLWQLFNVNIDDYYFAAVRDPIERLSYATKYLSKLAIPDFKQYVNSGVLVLNLEKIRSDGVEDKFMIWMKESFERGLFSDQDLINHVCYGKILLLPFKFNVMVNLINIFETYNQSQYAKNCSTPKDWEEARDPVVVHFAGSPKPWRNSKKTIFHEEFWNYAHKTAFYEKLKKEENERKENGKDKKERNENKKSGS